MARSTTDRQDRLWVRIPGTYSSVVCDRGQIITDPPGPKSEQLRRLDYLVRYETDREPFVCAECGAQFSEDVWRIGHIERRHRERAVPMPARMDGETDAQYSERVMLWKERQDEIAARAYEREMAQMAPNLEKTLATVHG